jgi:hypothetical protein
MMNMGYTALWFITYEHLRIQDLRCVERASRCLQQIYQRTVLQFHTPAHVAPHFSF